MAETAINLEPEESKADSLAVKSKEKIELLKNHISDMITIKEDKTLLVTVANTDQLNAAVTVQKMIDEERKGVYKDGDDLCKKANELHKSLVAKRDAAVAPYDIFKRAVVDGANAFIAEEKRKADEAAEKLRLEAQKKAEEDALAEAERLEAEGRTEEANEVLEAPVVAVTPVPVSTIPNVDKRIFSAARSTPVYKAMVTNRLTFLRGVKPETLLECLNEAAWSTIESGLSRKAKALGKAFSMPGCDIYEA